MLKLQNTPGFARDDHVMTRSQHKQVGQYRNPHGFLTTDLVPTDLVLAQSQARLQLPVDQFDCLTLLAHTHYLSWRQFGQIGHQAFRIAGPKVGGPVAYGQKTALRLLLVY